MAHGIPDEAWRDRDHNREVLEVLPDGSEIVRITVPGGAWWSGQDLILVGREAAVGAATHWGLDPAWQKEWLEPIRESLETEAGTRLDP